MAATNTIAENYVESIVSYCEGLGLFPHGGIDRADIRPGLRSQAQSTALYCPLPTPTYRYSWSGSGLSLAPAPFSSYDMCMVSEEQIQKWADEAEAGSDVEELKRRGRGRPGRGAEPMQVVAVRLTAEELDALDVAAAKGHMSRSEAIRAALAHFAA